MKRIFTVAMALALTVSAFTPAYAADTMRIKNADGVVEISEILPGAANENIIISVTTGQAWENVRENSSDSAIAFFGSATSDNAGKYTKRFFLNGSGEYLYKAAANGVSGSDINILYVNQTAQEAASNAMKLISLSDPTAAAAAIESNIETNKYSYELFGSLYDDTVEADAYAMVFAALPATEAAAVPEMVQKAFLAAKINGGAVSDITPYIDVFGFEEKNIDKQYIRTDKLTEKLANRTYAGVAEFDKASWETVVGTTIEYSDGLKGIQDVIVSCEDYLKAENAQFDTSKVLSSTSMIRAMINAADKSAFYSFDTLADYIVDYKEPVIGGGSFGGGGSGGGSGGGGGSLGGGGNFTIPPASIGGAAKPEDTEEFTLFEDVPKTHWARDIIERMYNKGVISGRTNREFYPEDMITREEFVKLLVTGLNFNTIGDAPDFTDVTQNDWYFDYVRIAYNSEIIKGISDTLFGAGVPITREQMAVMVNNVIAIGALDVKETGNTDKFTDENNISDYAKAAVEYVKNVGIMTGDGDGSFRPQDGATRAEAAKIVDILMTL